MISQCARCGRFIHGTTADPIITAKGLGWKNYHDACAQAEWARLGKSGEPRMPAKKKVVEEKKVQYHVQCMLIKNGKEESRWHNIVDTLAEAEEYCKAQMEPSEFDKNWQAMDEDKEAKKYSCNMSSQKYVNCTISMILKSGKMTVIDERLHPLMRKSIPEPRDSSAEL